MAKICIYGGGGIAHTLIPLLATAGHDVRLLTSKPERWNNEVATLITDPDGEVKKTYSGQLSKISNNPSDILGDVDIVLFIMPVYSYFSALARIKPFISHSQKIQLGCIYGQGGWDWMVTNQFSREEYPNLEYFALGLVPWVCRVKKYGHIGITYGAKYKNYIAMSDPENFQAFNAEFLNDVCARWVGSGGDFFLADSFLSISLSVDNQIIHTTRLYSISKIAERWTHEQEVPYFYRDYDQLSADNLEKLDKEFDVIRQKLKVYFKNDFVNMMNYLTLENDTYDSTNESVLLSFINSKTLGQITTPVVKDADSTFIIDKSHRFFKDDIYNGLVIFKWFAEELKLYEVTPVLDKILEWAQQLLNDDILMSNKQLNRDNEKLGIPNKYGLKTLDELNSLVVK